MDKESIDMVCVVGPTAVGKTELGLALAEDMGAEIVSADSMQVYRHMDIGTAKLPLEHRRGIVHHLIDVASPLDTFTVHDYAMLARSAVQDIHERGRLPVVVGGTGLYVRALVDHFDFTQTQRDNALRDELTRTAAQDGSQILHDRLRALDPLAAQRIHHNDARRIIRALEVVLVSGRPMAENYRAEKSPFRAVMVGLAMPRPLLYARIDTRVDHMMEQGLLGEVQTLLKMGCSERHTSMQAIGYKELVDHLKGNSSLAEAADAIKLASRRYAKRQLSWFRPDPRIRWYETPEDDMMRKNVWMQIRQDVEQALQRHVGE